MWTGDRIAYLVWRAHEDGQQEQLASPQMDIHDAERLAATYMEQRPQDYGEPPYQWVRLTETRQHHKDIIKMTSDESILNRMGVNFT